MSLPECSKTNNICIYIAFHPWYFSYNQEELEVLTTFIALCLIYFLKRTEKHQLQIISKYSGVYLYLFYKHMRPFPKGHHVIKSSGSHLILITDFLLF